MTVYMVAQVQILDPEQWARYKEMAAREIGVQRRLFFAQGTDELPAASA